MKISLRALRKIIRESLLIEYTVNNGVRLYHRSLQKYKVGDVLTSPKTNSGKHWLEDNDIELGLERARVKRTYEPLQKVTKKVSSKKGYVAPERKFESHENLPSRFDCIYATFVPQSRFVSKGYLYVVEPVGKMHVVDSRIIDKMNRVDYNGYGDRNEEDVIWHVDYNSELRGMFRAYWTGTEPNKDNLKNLEILMDSARVIEVIDESVNNKKMMSGERVQLSTGCKSFDVKFESYVNEEGVETCSIYDGKTRYDVSYNDVIDSIKQLSGVLNIKKHTSSEGSRYAATTLRINPPAIVKLFNVRMGEPGNNDDDYANLSSMTVTLDTDKSPMIKFNSELTRLFNKEFRKGLIKRV